MRLYRFDFEHRPWSTFGDADRIAAYNPLRRVPTLVLDDGEALLESGAILDYLDELARPGRSLIQASGPGRRAALRTCALATGVCDKLVSLLYERVLHDVASNIWVERCEAQVGGALDVLEADRARAGADFWFGSGPGHADIAVACAMRVVGEVFPPGGQPGRWPQLVSHGERCERMEEFQGV